MGWLRKRFGETNTAMGAGMFYMAMRQFFPQYAPLIDGVAAVAGVGFAATPQGPQQ